MYVTIDQSAIFDIFIYIYAYIANTYICKYMIAFYGKQKAKSAFFSVCISRNPQDVANIHYSDCLKHLQCIIAPIVV